MEAFITPRPERMREWNSTGGEASRQSRGRGATQHDHRCCQTAGVREGHGARRADGEGK